MKSIISLSVLIAAFIAGVSCMYRPNPSDPGCIVPLYYAPVCGASGKTYGNKEAARCYDDEVVNEGKCEGSEENGGNSEESEQDAPAPRPGLPRPMLGRTSRSSGRGVYVPNPDKPDCVAQLYYDPVCGDSKRTHVNRPTARCFDDAVVHEGECEDRRKRSGLAGMHTPNPDNPDCVVQLYYRPVCGVSGKTHVNRPSAGCFDDEILHEGKCEEIKPLPKGMHRPNPSKPDCVVQLYYSPVCGASGTTHVNRPTAGCFDDEVKHEGKCEDSEEDDSNQSSEESQEVAQLPRGMHRPNPDKPDCVVQLYYDPVCGVSGTTHVNRPTAGCFDDEVVHEGECEERKPLPPGMHRPNPANPDCVVQLYHSPVCGASGKTHINRPTAGCFDDEVVHEGECEEREPLPLGMHRPNPANPDCVVQLYHSPVCGASGRTHINRPTAGCFDDEVLYEGKCEEETKQSDEARPPAPRPDFHHVDTPHGNFVKGGLVDEDIIR